MKMIRIFTDGGCSGNPGPGGWAYVILEDDLEKRNSGGEEDTTNNRMELTAVISALEAVEADYQHKTPQISIYTDSQYVKNGITQWIKNWVRNGWQTSNRQPVKNQDLWRTLYEIENRFQIEWHWVKGHSGNEYNELCDSLVRQEMNKFL